MTFAKLPRVRTSFAGTLFAAVALLVAGVSGAYAQTIKIGSKNFTEQFIVAELYAAALENAGFKVERKINLGGTLVAHEALKSGAIDLYPEYTGTGFNAVMKATTTETDPEKVRQIVKAFYEKEFNLTWLKPSGINNGYAIVVRPETAKEYNLKTLTDLGKVANKLSLGAGTEFVDRRDGVAGLKEVYGAEFREFKQFAALRLRYEALAQKQVDIANGFSTDWQIAAEKFVALDDDKGLFPPYFLAPVVRPDIAANAKIVEALEKVGAKLDNATMQELNRQVEVDKKEPRTVAAAFLKAKGLVR
jgi:osmoprotectant transport system substrate-binding protein